MESNASTTRPVTRSAAGASEGAAHPIPAAADGVPTVLDLAASPALDGIAQRTLLDVSMDLFAKLEASLANKSIDTSSKVR